MAPNLVTCRLRDPRWTVVDKITQYKGLVKLQVRDAKVLLEDKRVSERKQKKLILDIKKDIDGNRDELIRATKSNPQLMRNILIEHKDLLLSFQNQRPEKTIEHLQHKNFIKRKKLDRLQYDMNKKATELTKLKLYAGSLEDNLLYSHLQEIPGNKKCQIISGRIQQATIKQEAALEVQKIYRRIIDILDKDRLCYDNVLNRLKGDAHQQTHCVQQAILLGQLATEYTDDCKQELDLLSRVIKRDLKSRLRQLALVRTQVENNEAHVKNLIRVESITRVPVLPPPLTLSEQLKSDHMKNEITKLEEDLEMLKEIVLVSNFECIFPCIEEQRLGYIKMQDIIKKSNDDKEILQKKINHAKLIYSHITSRTEESTFWYMEKKKALLNDVLEAQEKVKHIREEFLYKANILTVARRVMINIYKTCKVIKKPGEPKVTEHKHKSTHTDGIIALPEILENECDKIVEFLKTQLTILASSYSKYKIEKQSVDDFVILKNYEEYITKNYPKSYETEKVENEWLIEFEVFDQDVKTYSNIKAESKLIVEQNQNTEF